jgi:hypothetical protein
MLLGQKPTLTIKPDPKTTVSSLVAHGKQMKSIGLVAGDLNAENPKGCWTWSMQNVIRGKKRGEWIVCRELSHNGVKKEDSEGGLGMERARGRAWRNF